MRTAAKIQMRMPANMKADKVIVLLLPLCSTTYSQIWKKLAGQEGLEPPTDGFGVRNSTN